jgi:galactokinase
LAVETASLIAAHQARFGDAPAKVTSAPGRVNLIGEYTDFTGGFVLPIALDLACYVTISKGEENRLRIWSDAYESMREWPLDRLVPRGDWSDYPAGVAKMLQDAGFEVAGANMSITSTVPEGAGLSSSAALEVATALALLDGQPIQPLGLVRLARRAENDFVGMPCGYMDQYVSVRAKAGHALRIDCRDLSSEHVALPDDLAIIAVNSMVKHSLGQSEYRTRVEECTDGLFALQAVRPEIGCVREATLDDLARADMAPRVRRRIQHIISENLRVISFLDAAKRADRLEMGALLYESHSSLRDDFEVSCEELDFLVDTAREIEGVYGARMTGGGFGGCTVNLLRPDAVNHFCEAIISRYRQTYEISPAVYPCLPSAGALER